MANFETAYRYMKTHEWDMRRNFTNDPADPGGATMWGITLKAWKGDGSLPDLDGDGDVDADDLRLSNESMAKHFYASRYWIWSCINDDRLAAKLFDLGVNMGVGTAVKYLQRALNGMGRGLKVDGGLGPITAAGANAEDPAKLIENISALQAAHYSEWVDANPAREKFRKGLLARAASVPELASGASA